MGDDSEMYMQAPYELRLDCGVIMGLCDEFCDQRLNAEYKGLCRKLAVAICQAELPILRSKREIWAAAVVHTVGWVNFLSDPAQQPCMKPEEIAKGFGVSMALMAAKSKLVRGKLDLAPMHPEFCLPSRLADNPLVWMLEIENGVVFDVRMAPREVQQRAFDAGLIPFIPADTPAPVATPPVAEPPKPTTSKTVKPPKAPLGAGPSLFD